jgi:hypothetical protein
MNEDVLRKKVIRFWVFIMIGIPILAVVANLLGFYYIEQRTQEEVLRNSPSSHSAKTSTDAVYTETDRVKQYD